MIAKVPEKLNNGRSSFHNLKDYINRENPEGEKIALDAIEIETNCLSLDTAAYEMEAAANENGRVKDPVYHFILSWPVGENPTSAQAFDCAREAIKSVGMEGHQYVAGIHRDTADVHVHVMVNRVHPETAKSVYPDRDYYKLDRCMREMELRYSWAHDNGPFAVFERDGKKVIDWASVDKNSKEKIPTKAKDMERHTGEESLFTYVRGAPKKAVLQVLKNPTATWQALHATLAKYGLEIRPKGQGFGIYDKAHSSLIPLKASDMHESLSKNRLEKQLGPLQPPDQSVPLVKPERHYKRNFEQRERNKALRAAQRAVLKVAYAEYKLSIKPKEDWRLAASVEFKAILERDRATRQEIRNNGLPKEIKKAMYSVQAAETLLAKERLKAELKAKRQTVKRDPTQTALPYKVWVQQQAELGNEAAISQLRSWHYAEQRAKKRAAASESETENSISAEEDTDPIARNNVIQNLTWKVNRQTGDVAYLLNNRTAFIDQGRRLDFSQSDCSKEAIEAGLKLAMQKWGKQLTITGNDAFKNRVIETAIAKRVNVQFKDPAMQQRFEAMRSQAQVDQQRRGQRDKGMDKGNSR